MNETSIASNLLSESSLSELWLSSDLEDLQGWFQKSKDFEFSKFAKCTLLCLEENG
jgi:hypothetical protein